MRGTAWLLTFAVVVGGCLPTKKGKTTSSEPLELDVKQPWTDPADDYPSSKAELAAGRAAALDNPEAKTVIIRNGTVLTAAGQRYERGTVVLKGGVIRYVGPALPGSEVEGSSTVMVIDASDRFITPGIIDVHSHIGVYAAPHVSSHSDGNEMTAPATADARALYGYFPQDPAIPRALAGGVTTALILPGSANLVGGHGQVVIMKPGRHAREVVFPGAPTAVKMACGENPKRVYAEKGGPATRMGEYAAFRALFQQAAEYNAKWNKYRRDRQLWLRKRERAAELEAEAAKTTKRTVKAESAPEPPAIDRKLDTLAAVLRGEVKVQIHCYRASEIREMVEIADEFGFQIAAFHHSLEAYKVRDILAKKGIAIATWADWWGFKMEAFDGIPENAALFADAGGRAIIHSDSSRDIQRLNQEAGKALYAGWAAGIDVTEDEALRWITANAAHAVGIEDITGTLEEGKRADVVVWSSHPFSVYSKADLVIQGGEISYDRHRGMLPTDFELGNSAIDQGEDDAE